MQIVSRDIVGFRNSLEPLAKLLDEFDFKVDNNGISMKSTDRAMVVFVDFLAKPSYFDEYEAKNETFTVNSIDLVNSLKNIGKDSKIYLNLSILDKLVIREDSEFRTENAIPLLDATREELPKMEEVEKLFTGTIEINSKTFKAIVEKFDKVTDSVKIEIKENGIEFSCDKDMKANLYRGDSTIFGIDGNGKARYSLEYLMKIVKEAREFDKVKISFGNETPARFEFENDNLRVRCFLAPKIECEE